MGYKCEYDGRFGCINCKFHGDLSNEAVEACKDCTDGCPIVYGDEPEVCEYCKFEPKEVQGMNKCLAYRCVVPSEKRCMKKEEETGIKPSYCPFDGDYEKCRIVESLTSYRESLEREVTEVTEISFPKTNCNEKESTTTAVMPPHENAISTENITETEKVEPLKPCRCGVMPQLECNFSESVWIPPYAYTCPDCGFTTAKYETEKKAKEAWNMLITENLKNCAIKDSGERRQFETGAVRDMSEGKGLMVVMPAAALLRLSRHYEHGAQKYGKFNWQKGIPVSSFMDSALRHIMKYLDGWDDEDHLSAAAFNILGAMEMEAHKPDMQDIPAREGKVSFNYVEEEPQPGDF